MYLVSTSDPSITSSNGDYTSEEDIPPKRKKLPQKTVYRAKKKVNVTRVLPSAMKAQQPPGQSGITVTTPLSSASSSRNISIGKLPQPSQTKRGGTSHPSTQLSVKKPTDLNSDNEVNALLDDAPDLEPTPLECGQNITISKELKAELNTAQECESSEKLIFSNGMYMFIVIYFY